MNEEQRGELVGTILSYEQKIKLVYDYLVGVSLFLDAVEDKLNTKDDIDIRNKFLDMQYGLGKIKGLLK